MTTGGGITPIFQALIQIISTSRALATPVHPIMSAIMILSRDLSISSS